MVEYNITLDNIFNSLSDPTRRSILQRLVNNRLTVSEIASSYKLTFAAVSKHIKVLEVAGLITKKRRGKEKIISLSPKTLDQATRYLVFYQKHLDDRLDSLENYLNKEA